MKFSKVSQLVLVSSLGLLLATLLSGCLVVTVDYVFVTTSSGTTAGATGQIQIYAADAESGVLRPVDTAVSSGGSNPVALATTSDYANLYVANQSNNSLVHFAIAYDGSLTEKDTVTVPFTPASIAVNLANTDLYVAGGSNPAQIAVYPLSSGTLGTLASTTTLTVPGFTSDILFATGVALTQGTTPGVYVTVYDQSAYNPGCLTCVTSSANPGWLFGFTPGSNGSLTATAGSPYQAGVKPTAIAADPTYRFLYATDFASNQLIGYNLQAGVPEFMVDGPFNTGSEPTSVTVDPRGLFIYVANALSNNVSAYTISLSTGVPSAVSSVTGSATTSTDTEPVSIIVEPALGRYVYTANTVGADISGFDLNPQTGVLKYTQATPYNTGSDPTALAAVPHGNHAVESVPTY